jgi:hypothetical protein
MPIYQLAGGKCREAQVLGRERVLEKKHAQRFGLFAELDGFVGRLFSTGPFFQYELS